METTGREGLPFGKETPLEIIQQIGKDGLSGGISDVCLFPTYKCNLDCYMCHVQYVRHKDDSYLSVDQLKEKFDHMTVETLFHLGGEPFVRKEILEILNYFDSKGTKQIISTNGTNITESLAEDLAKLKHLVCMQVSLNGSGENDNSIRGTKNAFQKTVEGINILKKAGLQVWIHSVILNENIDDLANIVKLGSELGVEMVNFLFGQVMSEQDAQDTKEMVQKWIGEDVDIGGFVGELNYSKEQLIQSVNAAKEEGRKHNLQVLFFPRIFGERPELYWDGTLLEEERPICQMTLMPPLTPIVGPEGDVFACCIIDKSFGNIKEKSLEEIWNSEPVRDLRKGLINGKLMPICKRCPSGDLMEVTAPKEESLSLFNWTEYLESLTRALNELPELAPVLEKISPVVFQYHMQDRAEYNYWHSFKKNEVTWGVGENTEEHVPKIIHSANVDIIKKVNAGEINPIQATMDGTYSVDGDMRKLMDCAPLIPITIKAHSMTTLAGEHKTKPQFRHKTDLKQMYADIIKAAEIAEVTYDNAAIQKVLDAYKDFFSGSAITFTTNTKPKEQRRLAVRYVELQVPHDPYAMALSIGLLSKQEHPIHNLLLELQTKEDILGYGIDLAIDYGVAKIWPFLRQLPEIGDLCSRLSHMPDSMNRHLDYFKNHNLKYVSLFALDFRNTSTNIYFMIKDPKQFSPDKAATMFEELGLKTPPQEMLEHCSKAVTIYYTFKWDSPHIERACFGVIEPEPIKIPTHLDPLVEKYVNQAPILTKERTFIYSITASRNSVYFKIENDYTNSMTSLMRVGIQVVPS